VARSTVARAETGDRDLPVSVLVRAAELAGLRLGLLDAGGREVPGMTPGAVCDRAGRRFPAHLDTRFSDDGWWHGPERYSRERPWYTFDRGRDRRDAVREVIGTPPDHQQPGHGDAPAERARVRTEAAVAARAARWRQEVLQGLRPGPAGDPALTCTCPPACDDLLFPDGPLPTRQLAVPHVDDCACRCDIG
jgi:hypothetical protein